MNIQAPTAPNLQMSETLKTAGETITNSLNDAKNSFNQSVNGFSQQAEAGAVASQGFLQSNTIIAKFAFIILVIIAFLFLMNLGINLIVYFTSPSNNPYIIKGKVDGNSSKVISTDPTISDSVPIIRSNNQTKGIEFTWSFWIYINDLGDGTKAQNIFNKGSRDYNSNGIAATNNSPGVYLISTNPTNFPTTTPATPNELKRGDYASLKIIMNTAMNNDDNSSVTIDDIPIRKWVHIAIRMQNTIMDTYVNGLISNRKVLNNTPKQNYYDINLFQNGGFSGNLSNFRYYNYSLNAFEINSIVYYGPNMTASTLDTSATGNYTYLSNYWYSSKL
jgi:hypothetical protein